MSNKYPAPGSVIVHIVDPAKVQGACLNRAEEELAGRFRFERDAARWRACRSVLRMIMGEILESPPEELVLETGEHGKPALAKPHQGLHFNLSHCDDLALIALSMEGEIGVDIEPADRGTSLLGCEASFCHPEEIAGLPLEEDRRALALIDLWTRKEALLKALGTGMSLAPETVSLADPTAPHPRLLGFGVRRLHHPALERHIAHLAAPHACTEAEIRIFQG